MFNVYNFHDGKVKSLVHESSTEKFTVGLMAEGTYLFFITTDEEMTVIHGFLQVLLPDSNHWQTFIAGTHFLLPKNSTVEIRSVGVTAYLCRYL